MQLKANRVAAEADGGSLLPPYSGPAFFSDGFRPFFLSASLFAGLAVPLWILSYAGTTIPASLYPPREWHVHEMLFGFLPAVLTGFLLTAIPNWTGRPPVKGIPLMMLWILWLAGRLLLALAWPAPLVAAAVDAAFLVVLAAVAWREISTGGNRKQAPIVRVVSLYAGANILFHSLALNGRATDVAERMALGLVMLLLAMVGGRVTPNFTREFLIEQGAAGQVAPFSRFDALSIVLLVAAALAWIIHPESLAAGGTLIAAGLVHMARLSRWRGWLAWREPLVLILQAGYGWLALSLLALGGAAVGHGLPAVNAVHVLTSGAVGAMTLGIMTRASLGHTGRPRHAGPLTVLIYVLVNLGGLLRIFVPMPDAPTALTYLMLAFAAAAWSGAYLLFALVYGPLLVRPSLDA